MKYLLMAVVVYSIYRFFIVPKQVESRYTNDIEQEESEGYTDYEEIDE